MCLALRGAVPILPIGELRSSHFGAVMAHPAILQQVTPTADAPRRRTHAALSLVVVFGDDSTRMYSALASTAAACDRADVELVVVSSGPAASGSALRAALPNVRWVSTSADVGERERRALGLRSAQGDLVRLVDASSLLDERWISGLLGRGSQEQPLS